MKEIVVRKIGEKRKRNLAPAPQIPVKDLKASPENSANKSPSLILQTNSAPPPPPAVAAKKDKQKRGRKRKTFAAISHSGDKLYCNCKKKYHESVTMIKCYEDDCDEWFHPRCVGLKDATKSYHCIACQEKTKEKAKIAGEKYCLCENAYDSAKNFISCTRCLRWIHDEPDCKQFIVYIGDKEAYCKICYSEESFQCDCIEMPLEFSRKDEFVCYCIKCKNKAHIFCQGLLPDEEETLKNFECKTCSPEFIVHKSNSAILVDNDNDYAHLNGFIKNIENLDCAALFLIAPILSEKKRELDLEQIESKIEKKKYTKFREFIDDLQMLILQIMENSKKIGFRRDLTMKGEEFGKALGKNIFNLRNQIK